MFGLFGKQRQPQEVKYISIFDKHELEDVKQKLEFLQEKYAKLEFEFAKYKLEHELSKTGVANKLWDRA
jgi:hypothetical protein